MWVFFSLLFNFSEIYVDKARNSDEKYAKTNGRH